MLIVRSERKFSYGASLDYLYSFFSARQETCFYITIKVSVEQSPKWHCDTGSFPQLLSLRHSLILTSFTAPGS